MDNFTAHVELCGDMTSRTDSKQYHPVVRKNGELHSYVPQAMTWSRALTVAEEMVEEARKKQYARS